jgi:hypothetical protein
VGTSGIKGAGAGGGENIFDADAVAEEETPIAEGTKFAEEEEF